MAKVVKSEQQVIAEPWWVKGRIIYIGLAIGLVWWVLTAILRQYVVEPIACRDLASADTCVNAFGVSGDIATILVAILGTWLLIRYLQPRPIVVAIATVALLWGLGGLLAGLAWWAVLLWALFFYVASYALFSMVARIPWVWLSVAVAVVIVIGVRLLLVVY